MKNSRWLRIFDTWLLERVFQPFSNWFQRFTGQDNFFLAVHLLNVNIGINFSTDLLLFRQNGEIIVFVGTLLKLSLYPLIYKKICGHSRRPRNCVFVNNLRIHPLMLSLRVFAYIFTTCGVVYLAGKISRNEGIDKLLLFIMANRFLFLGVVYFLSCTPLPPGKSRLSKWFSSIKSWVTSLSQPGTTAPEPT